MKRGERRLAGRDAATKYLQEAHRITESSQVDSSVVHSVTLECPAGETVVSGGAAIKGSSDVNLVLTDTLKEGPAYFARAVETHAVDANWGSLPRPRAREARRTR